MKKSIPVNLLNYNSDDNLSEDIDDFSYSDEEENDSVIYSAPIEHFSQMFKIQDFKKSKNTHLPPFNDDDFDLSKLNVPLLTPPIPKIQPVSVAYLMCSQTDHFPQPDSEYFISKPTLYMWRNMKNVLPSEFATFAQDYFHDKYIAIKKPLRFFFHVLPTVEKLNNVVTIRRDVQEGRILFHYIGYGFQTIGDDIYALDKKSNRFLQYPLRNIFDSIRSPAWFVFDCSNAAAALKALKSTAEYNAKKDKSDWNDWICFCATSANESLPSDPHLPRDFLTSCLLTPTRIAVLCHILQYYRTTLVSDTFPLKELDGPLLRVEDANGVMTPLHKILHKTLNAITDAIAADVLPADFYKKYFQADQLTNTLFRNFLLAQYLLRPFQIHPVSSPALPDLSVHPLWQQWRTIVDMTVFCNSSPIPNFFNDLYKRAMETADGFLRRGDLEKLPIHILMILFHLPEEKTLISEAFIIIAQYAAKSEKTREILSNVGHFDVLIKLALSDMFNDMPNTFHAICYLIVVMLQKQPSYANIDNTLDVSKIADHLFDEKLHQDTRTLVAVIVATLIPCNDRMRQIAVAEPFFLKLRTLLETSGAELSLWALIIERKMFDSFGLDLRKFYQNGLHIQTASFCLHYAPEVRAAALATLPCLLQVGQDTSNMHLFGIAIFSVFDGSYVVRFNFLHFIARFLAIYADQIQGQIPLGLFLHQPYISLISQWVGNDLNDIISINELLTNFDAVSSFVTQMIRSPDSIHKCVGIALFLTEHLSIDPHPSIRELASSLQQQNVNKSGIKNKLNPYTSNNKMSVPVMNGELSPIAGSAPLQMVSGESEDEYEPGTKPASCDSGGDALYKSCISQIVRSGLWKPYYEPRRCSNITALPPAPVSSLPSIEVHCHHKYELGKKPTDIAYDKDSRDVAISFDDGTVSYIHENGIISTIKFPAKVTSLQVTQYDSKPYTLIGNDDGSCHIWDCYSQHPSATLRTDGNPQCRAIQLISPVNNQQLILTARGNCGTVRLWDVKSERLIHEWLPTQNNKDNFISGLTVDPETGSCVIGFSTGLLVILETMAKTLQRTGNPNVAVSDKIIDLKATLSPEKTFFAATQNGKLLKWTDFSVISPFVNLEGEKIISFDVHSFSPLLCISTEKSAPTLISCEGKVLHKLKEPGSGAIIRFHPSLPVIGAVSETGSLYEYDIYDVGSPSKIY